MRGQVRERRRGLMMEGGKGEGEVKVEMDQKQAGERRRIVREVEEMATK